MAGVKKFKHIPLKRERLAAISSNKSTKTKKTVEVPDELLPLKIEEKKENDAKKIFTSQVEKKQIPTQVSRDEGVQEKVIIPTSKEAEMPTLDSFEKNDEVKKEDIITPKEQQKEEKEIEKVVVTTAPIVYTKEEKNKAREKKKFPNIFRFITDRWFLFGIICGILVVAIIIIVMSIQSNLQQKHELEKQRATIQQELSTWQKNEKKYPGYRDAYFQMALWEYQLGNFQAAQGYLEKVKLLDPNFQEAYKLEKLMQK